MNSGPVDGITKLPNRGEITAQVIDGLPLPIIISRLADDRVMRVNREFTAAYGHTTDAVADRPVSDLHMDGDRQLTLDRHAGGAIDSVEVRIKAADGEWCWARADVARFVMGGDDILLTTLNDVRHQKRTELLLEEMARFPEMNPGPVVRLDATGTVLRCNQAALTLFGDDLEGLCLWERCPGFSREVRAAALIADEPVREDVRVGEKWFRFTMTHVPNTDTTFVFGSDITSEREAEKELAERARFPAMNPGPVARLDSEGRVIRANPAATALFDRSTLRGLSWLELFPDIDGNLWNRLLRDQAVVQQEAQLGDRWFSFVLRHEPVANQVFVYGSDMTELKAAERALSELARFPDMNPGPVCRLDRQGTVLLANRAASRVFGIPELAGLRWQDLVPVVTPERWALILDTSDATVIEARIGSTDLVLTHAPGPEGLFVFVYGSDVTREKEAERALRQSEKMATLGTLAAGVAHELNNPAAAARRAAEQLDGSLAAMQAAQLAFAATDPSRDWSPVLAEMSIRAREAAGCGCDLSAMDRANQEAEMEDWLEEHGVEEPWEIASTLVEAGMRVADANRVRDQFDATHLGKVMRWQADTFRVHRLLEEIRHGASRISEIVGAMKAYSYLGQAQVQDVDVNDGIRNTLIILRSKLRQGIRVETALSPDLPTIEALGSELNQVWTNLIDNAVYAMGGSGTIRITSTRVGDQVAVTIEDDGPGIPAETQSRVFDAFFTTKPPGAGTGLGLHTTYNIVVNKHGGTIRLDSEPGCTRFTVKLPLTLSKPVSDGEMAPPE